MRKIELQYSDITSLPSIYDQSVLFIKRPHYMPPFIDLLDCSIKTINGDCNIMGLNLQSLEGIGTKYFTEINGKLSLSASSQSNILGLLKIKNLRGISLMTGDHFYTENSKKAFSIVMKHFGQCSDIIDCQDELIEAGLKEFAKL
jgi:hypothetical protein